MTMSVLAFIAGSGKAFAGMTGGCEITRFDVTMPYLPRALDGLRAAVISDIHAGPFMSGDEIAEYVDLVNSLNPDMIFLPGDFVTSSVSEIPPVCEALRGLRAKHGIFGCLGNHDFIVDSEMVTRRLNAAGVHILRNRHAVLRIDRACLAIIGVDDVTPSLPFDASFPVAVSGLDPSVPSIVLCHKPYPLEDAALWGVPLMVSGHTHGGQIVLGKVFGTVFAPAAAVTPYIAGLYRLDATRLYVTRGIGTVFLPRFNCPPEITLLTLRCEDRP
ncbi:MAG: metallophosphoesterase [Bacteroidota bacterium]|nr:metallophosphoesterase [Bacteroidota bacterium]